MDKNIENNPMNHNIFTGQWKQMRGTLGIGERKDKLIGLVQEKYGYTLDQAQDEVDRRFNEYGDKDSTANVRDMKAPRSTSLAKPLPVKHAGRWQRSGMNLQRRGLPCKKTNWRLWLQTSGHSFASTRSHCYSSESVWAAFYSATEMTRY